MTRLQVVIPMAGSGSRFAKASYTQPKPLLDVAGVPLIQRLIAKFPRDCEFVFIGNQEHLAQTELRRVLLVAAPGARIAEIPPHKKGPVHTVLGGVQAIKDDLPTIVNYCDFSFSWDSDDFLRFAERTDADGIVLCYRGFHPHYLRQTLYAYCREEGGRVLDIKEKGHFTPDRTKEYASSGTYYFKSGRLMKSMFQRAMSEGFELNGEYYISLAYKPMLHDGMDIRVFEIPFFLQWGTPEDLEDYLYWHRTFDWLARWKPTDGRGGRLLMPMAGLGSRFKDMGMPKPLIPVLGQPMFRTAQRFLPCNRQPPVLILHRSIESQVAAAQGDSQRVVIDAPTEGQADTTALGLPHFDPKEPVFVSACDHGLVWDATSWKAMIEKDPDLIIVGQRGYPGARRTPQAFSYFAVDAHDRITRVSVKKPLTDQPHQELVLVGTFYFRNAALLSNLIQELKEKNIRVNNERYLDSVVELALQRGLKVLGYSAAGYLNWGTPEALQEFTYWHRYFLGAHP